MNIETSSLRPKKRKRPKRRKVLRVRQEVLEIQNNHCAYCGHDFIELNPTNHHRDHNQNNNYEDNVVVGCERCHDKINTVEAIFIDASDRLRQEIVYAILRVAPPHLATELIGKPSNF